MVSRAVNIYGERFATWLVQQWVGNHLCGAIAGAGAVITSLKEEAPVES